MFARPRTSARAKAHRFDYNLPTNQSAGCTLAARSLMLNPLIRTLVKVVVASLIVGTILSHFSITAEQMIEESGLSYERVEDMARRGLS